MQLREVADWRDDHVGDYGNEVRERLVKQLQDSGQAKVQAYCGPKQLKKPESNEVWGEIDAAAVGENCALIAEVKTTLTDKAVYELICLLHIIRDMVEEGAPLADPFKDKRLLGVVAGRIITHDKISSQILMAKAASHNFPILPPDGKGFSIGDGCATASDCSASTSRLSCRHAPASWRPASRPGACGTKSPALRGRSCIKAPRMYQQQICVSLASF
ncbi:hypothetical protein WJX74_000300 [Apatococcus lobatus]|uniref:Uncharacterized protein n=1 Tax=Apatococcus lobatus TaxID=904363 RepID=A0AAW1SDR6_9CHLO